jgi:antirestriction protein ArdC
MNTQNVRDGARRDVAADITAKILSELERGVMPWRKPWDGARTGLVLPRRATGETYRGVNVISSGAPQRSAATLRPTG